MKYRFMARIRAVNELRVLQTVYADYVGEIRTMAQNAAERLMLKGDITEGAVVSIAEINNPDYPFEEYYWPQLDAAHEEWLRGHLEELQ